VLRPRDICENTHLVTFYCRSLIEDIWY